jgi:hypothetical protein
MGSGIYLLCYASSAGAAGRRSLSSHLSARAGALGPGGVEALAASAVQRGHAFGHPGRVR